MYERFTDRARNIVEQATGQAHALHHEYIGTEHLLLVILNSPESTAARMITSQGICLGEVRSQLLKLLFVGTDPSGTSKTPLSPFAKQAFERAEVISTDFEHSEVGTGHILLALLEVPGGFAREALDACGFTLETSKKELRKLFDRLASELDPTPIPSSIG